jgi:hypothetical protein
MFRLAHWSSESCNAATRTRSTHQLTATSLLRRFANFDPRTVQPVGSRYTGYATRPTIAECYCSKLRHHLLSSTLLCLTSSSYKMILSQVSEEDSTA